MPESSQCASSAGLNATPYNDSLARLDRHVGHIPMGWQRLYADLRCSLRVLVAPQRMNIQIDGGWEEDGLLCVDSPTVDPVVQGVLRKARTRAMHTCTECGKPGRRRELKDWQEVTLCSSCAALRLLSLDIQRVLALEKCGSLDLRKELQSGPEAVLIRAAAEAAANAKGLSANLLGQESLEDLRAWLELVRDLVEEMLMADQG
jgi:hypothetical protein